MTATSRPAVTALARRTYAALGLRFRITGDNAPVVDELADLYASCADQGRTPTAAVTVELRCGDPGFWVRIDAGEWTAAADRNTLFLAAMALIDGAAVAASSGDLLIIHASAAMAHAGPVLFVGPSGAGKSTLAAALAVQGWPYVGDEAVGLDETAAHLIANPKPLKLDPVSRVALFGNGRRSDLEAAGRDDETLVAPHALGPVVETGPVGPPVAVVQITYRSGAPAKIAPTTRADVAEALAAQSFNFARWGGRGLDTVAALARAAAGFRLEFGDADDAIAQLEQVLL